ncbi:protoporphyrinogen oxidase [Streptomyces sp. I05A-00742]|uniref:protoporphyrinogen oxidase n=1 Tax=Streptomyces sp. I05A-00742 TaxID=2732853 RepID=UPI001489A1E5|nr:protoporphyrinogen oxidase [Streptomyces sp. I05A-00742]
MSEVHTHAHHVAVVGGGISGLTAALRLLERGVRVTVLEGSGRLGGKLLAGEIAGVPVDLGAESMLARRPEAVELARDVGLGARLQAPATTTAGVWTRDGLRPLPKGHMMGVPGDLAALAASGVLSEQGLAAVARDAELPPTEIGEDIAVGTYVAERLGPEVVDRLVEPLLGGVYAGDAYRTSLRAAVPRLFEAARTHRSLTEAVRALTASVTPQAGAVFAGIDGGVGLLPLAVADAVRAAGGEIRVFTPVAGLARHGHGWRLDLGHSALEVDGVVLATPAPAAARLLAGPVPAAAAELAGVEYASMALVTLAFRRADVAGLPRGSGFLVPPGDGRRIKASTFASNKWGWIAAADPGVFVLRTSVGRYGDERDLGRDDADLVRLSLADLGEAVGLDAVPLASRVTRWDHGLPQYPVGHLARVARVREQVGRLPGLRICGAAYDGVGIPACVGDARRAAEELIATLPVGAVGAGGQ